MSCSLNSIPSSIDLLLQPPPTTKDEYERFKTISIQRNPSTLNPVNKSTPQPTISPKQTNVSPLSNPLNPNPSVKSPIYNPVSPKQSINSNISKANTPKSVPA